MHERFSSPPPEVSQQDADGDEPAAARRWPPPESPSVARREADEVRARTPDALAAAERLAVLDASGLLTPTGADALQRVARLTATALRTPLSQINVVTRDAQIPVAVGGGDGARWAEAVPLAASYCQYVVATEAPLVVPDAQIHPLVSDSLATKEAGIRAYAGVPLRAPAALGGHVLGSVCAVDFAPREWSVDDLRVLEELADLATERITWTAVVRDSLTAAGRELVARDAHLDTLAAAMARQLAELETIYAHAGVGLCVFDTELRWVRINERLAEINGFPAPAHVGRRIRDLLPAVAEEAERPLRQVLATGEPLLGVELTGETPARPGERRVWREHFLPLRDPSGVVVGVNVVCEEITEQRRAEAERAALLGAERAAREEAEQARAAAEAANRVKSDFLATMSHELRTPLNAIAGFSDLIAEGYYGPVSTEQRDALGRIRRSQRHLLGLIEDVLSYTRIDAQRVRYHPADVAVAELLAEAQTLVVPQAGAKRIALTVDACGADVVARADAGRVRQVLLNLLANAVKFTPAGGAVRVSCGVSGSRVVLSVSDTGIGIPGDQREAIFEPFVQVDAGLARAQQGTGLGLAISREYARGMGGDLTVESVLGAGSTFTLLLPRGRRDRDAATT